MSGPGAVLQTGGRLVVFAVGADGAVWHAWQTSRNGSWSPWASLGTPPGLPVTSDPDAALNHPGGLVVFVRAGDNAIWHRWQSGPDQGWSDWESLGGSWASGPGTVLQTRGRLVVFARGWDNAIHHRWQETTNGDWSGWHAVPGHAGLTSDPDATLSATGGLVVFARQSDGAITHAWQDRPDGDWIGWESLGGAWTSGPGAARQSRGRLVVVACAHDGAVHRNAHVRQGGEWSGWQRVEPPLVLASDPDATLNDPGGMVVFGRGHDGGIWHSWQGRPDGAWIGPGPLFAPGPPPTIGAVEPAGGTPGRELTIHGGGFAMAGPQLPEVHFRAGQAAVRAAPVGPWSDNRITVRAPGVARFNAIGKVAVSVTRRDGASATRHGAYTIYERPSITTWTRLEASARREDLEAGLREGLQARVHDPAWLLARQWQLGEFQGEDAGSPVQVRVRGHASPLARWRPGRTGPGRPLAVDRTPLEAIVEREEPLATAAASLWAARLGIATGLHFLRLVAQTPALQPYGDRAREVYPLKAPTQAERAQLDPSGLRLLDLGATRAPDGRKLARALDGHRLAQALRDVPSTGRLPAELGVDPKHVSAMVALTKSWLDWRAALVQEGEPGASTWQPDRMEHAFSVGTETARGELVLTAREYPGGSLDWHHFALEPGASLRETAGVPTTVKRVEIDLDPLPAAVAYPGMPAERWWEMEDARVDFGGIDAAPGEPARMLAVEFATAYGGDWFVVPVGGVPPGSVVRLTSVTVRTTFGEEHAVGSFSAGVGGAWRAFELTTLGGGPASTDGLLFVPPKLPSPLEGEPVEVVDLLRDEMANLVWGVERTIEGPRGRPMERSELEPRAPAGGPHPAPAGPPAYRLALLPPSSWFPYVRPAAGAARARERAGLPLAPGASTQPRGRLLAAAARLHDDEIPTEGAQVTRRYQYARWLRGTTVVWVGRRKRPGRPSSSSGLRFDALVEPE